MAQPSEESSSVAATPPWTDPIGLYIHSSGVKAKTTRPSSTSAISNSSSSAIGGGGSSPAAILRIASMPGSEAAATAVSSGSDQLKVRTRWAGSSLAGLGCVTQPSLSTMRRLRAPGAHEPRLGRGQRERLREQQAEPRERHDRPHHGLQTGAVGQRAQQRGGDAAGAD